ncbi:MAG: type I-C CRISPR-associated protein Cas8c/Csd1 [Deferribacterales bacterium]
MILQALNDYYNRLASEGEDIPLPGFSEEKISFCIVIDKEGNLIRDEDIRDHEGKKPAPKLMKVPAAVKRASGVNANLLWDNIDYTLGICTKDKPERTLQQFEDFRAKCISLSEKADTEPLRVLTKFLNTWNTENSAKLNNLEEMKNGANIVFRIEGEQTYIHDYPEVKRALSGDSNDSAEENIKGTCLVTGEKNVDLARLHPSIKGFAGQTTGGSIVSFNKASFTSYNKTQSYNSPVSSSAAFAYVTVLNKLLSFDSRQKVRIGDTTIIFWTERETPAESLLSAFFSSGVESEANDNTGDNKKLRNFLESARNGKSLPPDFGDEGIKFFILGLSPNAARISVRFWNVSTLGEIHKLVGQHLQDCEIEKQYPADPEVPGIWKILLETALQRKSENIPPLLEGAYSYAVITGRTYPQTILNKIINRIRADGNINYIRAYALKGYFNRKARINKSSMEVTVSLNKENRNPAYLLGRLFAVLEKAQQDAVQAKATIKDRFYGAASATPASVFPLLLRLAQHHISKAEYGRFRDMEIQEIAENISVFPKTLNLEEQGIFALGYYHQKNSMYKSNKKDKEQENVSAD